MTCQRCRLKSTRMNVLSLFDGMSCGYEALKRAGIKIDKYYASEIDKYAIAVSKYNYPNIIRLGDVKNWLLWDIDFNDIDLIIGGSPCTSFSVAGKGEGFNGESGLFYIYLDILKHINPKYFLFENVKMKKEWRDEITKLMGVDYIEINSALLSAQSRIRLYWTNIPGITQPEDKGILLKNILDEGYVDRDKSYCIDARYYSGVDYEYCKKKRRQLKCIQVGNADIKGLESIKRVYSKEGKSPTLTSMGGGHREPKVSINDKESIWRKLTPVECERLQNLNDNATAYGVFKDKRGNDVVNKISNTQRYKMIGNGWTVDVIAHIFKHIAKT